MHRFRIPDDEVNAEARLAHQAGATRSSGPPSQQRAGALEYAAVLADPRASVASKVRSDPR